MQVTSYSSQSLIFKFSVILTPFPLQQSEQYEKPDDLSSNQEALLDHLIVDEAKLNTIEKKTSEQAASQEWQAERKFRYTASNCKKAKES